MPTASVFYFLEHLYFCGGELDRHNLLVVSIFTFSILTLVSFLFSVRIGRETFDRESDPRIGEFYEHPKGPIWPLPEAVCHITDDFGFVYIVDSWDEFNPVLTYRVCLLSRCIDLEDRPMNESYLTYDWREGMVSSISAVLLSVPRFGDGDDGQQIRTRYDDRSFLAVDPSFSPNYSRTDLD